LTPQVQAKTVTDHASGAYSVAAAPGLGYSYRWDENDDGKWDSEDFGDKKEVSFNLDVDKSRTVRLEVKNAFGRIAEKKISVTRPKPDKSGAPTTMAVERLPDGTLRGVPRGAGAPE
jgi:NADH-quinone oxidoreductase subunit L